MGFAGELTTIGLGEVFQNIAFNRLTGVLRVTARDQHAEVYAEEGRLRAFSHGHDKPFDYALIAERSDCAPPEAIRVANRRRRRRTLRAMLAKSCDEFDDALYFSALENDDDDGQIWRFDGMEFTEAEQLCVEEDDGDGMN